MFGCVRNASCLVFGLDERAGLFRGVGCLLHILPHRPHYTLARKGKASIRCSGWVAILLSPERARRFTIKQPFSDTVPFLFTYAHLTAHTHITFETKHFHSYQWPEFATWGHTV